MGCELEINYTIDMHKSIDRILECMYKILLQEDVVIDCYYSFDYEIIRLLSGTRIISFNSSDYLDKTKAYLIELTTDKNVKLLVFKSRLERDVYVLNNYWLLPNDKLQFSKIQDVINMIKKTYKSLHAWHRKYLEFRDDIDRSILQYDVNDYNRYHGGYKTNLIIKSIIEDCNDFIFKVDKDRYLLKVEINKYIEVIVSKSDMYIGNHTLNISDSEVLEYSNSLDYVLCNVVNNEELFKQDVCKMFKSIIKHNPVTHGYDLIANRHGDILMGYLEFKT